MYRCNFKLNYCVYTTISHIPWYHNIFCTTYRQLVFPILPTTNLCLNSSFPIMPKILFEEDTGYNYTCSTQLFLFRSFQVWVAMWWTIVCFLSCSTHHQQRTPSVFAVQSVRESTATMTHPPDMSGQPQPNKDCDIYMKLWECPRLDSHLAVFLQCVKLSRSIFHKPRGKPSHCMLRQTCQPRALRCLALRTRGGTCRLKAFLSHGNSPYLPCTMSCTHVYTCMCTFILQSWWCILFRVN